MSQSRKKRAIALSVGEMLNTALTLIIMIVFSRILTKSELATYRQTLLAYETVAPILTLGIPTAIYYFLSEEKIGKKNIILESMSILFFTGTCFSLFLILGGNNLLALRFDNPQLKNTLSLFTFYPMYTFPGLVLVSSMIILNRVKTATLYNIISNFLMSITILLTCIYTKNYILPLKIKVIFPFITLPILLYLSFFSIKEKVKRIDLKNMIRMTKFGFPLGISSTLAVLSVQLDKVLVSAFSSPEEFAVYSNGALEIPLVGIITGAIGTVIMVDMKKMIDNNEKEKALLLYKNSAVKCSIILFPVMVFLFFYGNEFMEILFSSKYTKSSNVFRIYLLLLPIRIMNYGTTLTILGKSKDILRRSCGDLLINLILSCIFMRCFGIYGAAWATVISIYFWHVPFNLYFISKGFGCRLKNIVFYKKVLKILFISMVSIIVPLLLEFFGNGIVTKFILGGIAYGISYMLLSYFYVPEFFELITLLINKVKKSSL